LVTGLKPSEIRTDSLNSYNQVVKETMPDAKHIANCGIKKQHANNNRIERLNGTIRERVKVQRGWPQRQGENENNEFQNYRLMLANTTFTIPYRFLEGGDAKITDFEVSLPMVSMTLSVEVPQDNDTVQS
jgi:hypothetical protein